MDSLVELIKLCLTRRYFKFSGRASRREFWGFYIFTIITMAVGYTVFQEFSETYKEEGGLINMLFLGLIALVMFYLVIPTISVTIRRLHDTGKSGLWILVSFIPSVGQLILLILCLLPSEPFDNRYGQFNPYY